MSDPDRWSPTEFQLVVSAVMLVWTCLDKLRDRQSKSGSFGRAPPGCFERHGRARRDQSSALCVSTDANAISSDGGAHQPVRQHTA